MDPNSLALGAITGSIATYLLMHFTTRRRKEKPGGWIHPGEANKMDPGAIKRESYTKPGLWRGPEY